MIFRAHWFTLVELMIVIAILWILIASMFPKLTAYYSRGRDIGRIADVRALSATFQDYNRTSTIYPNNINAFGSGSYCISEIMSWQDALPIFTDKQYSHLWGTWTYLRVDPTPNQENIGLCTLPGSYFYARLLHGVTYYAVIAARMELQVTGANYTQPLRLSNPIYVPEMLITQPLDRNTFDTDRLYLLITN